MFYNVYEVGDDENKATLTTYILDAIDEVDKDIKRPTIVICPGGGYERTSNREAEPIAMQLNAMGYNACVLRYTCAPAVFPTALYQLAKSVALVRENAKEWNVDTDRVFVMGFSAGGHLACSLGCFWNNKEIMSDLDIASEKYKPNGMILSYPVISSGEFAHVGSFKNLLGDKYADEEMKKLVSLEYQVSKDTPKAFIWHTFEDKSVPVENSLRFAMALREKDISFALHIYEHGGHGLSLGTKEVGTVELEVQGWIDELEQWIQLV